MGGVGDRRAHPESAHWLNGNTHAAPTMHLHEQVCFCQAEQRVDEGVVGLIKLLPLVCTCGWAGTQQQISLRNLLEGE